MKFIFLQYQQNIEKRSNETQLLNDTLKENIFVDWYGIYYLKEIILKYLDVAKA